MVKTIDFIICTEKGYLENSSKLLVWSIRRALKDKVSYQIISICPRANHGVSNETKLFFKENNVLYIEENLNSKYVDYPLANKPLSASYWEQKSEAEVVVFLDSDIMFLKYPRIFDDEFDIVLRPVDTVNIATDLKFSNKYGPYWKALYKEMGVTQKKQVTTTIDQEDILEYYNSGIVIAKRSLGVFKKWKKNFENIYQTSIRPPEEIFFLEQSIFAATVAQLKLKVTPMSKAMNYPIHMKNIAQNENYMINSLREIESMHYHKIFKNWKGNIPFKKDLEQAEGGRDVIDKIYEFKVVQKERTLRQFYRQLKRLLTN